MANRGQLGGEGLTPSHHPEQDEAYQDRGECQESLEHAFYLSAG